MTAGTDGALVQSIIVTSSDTSAVVLRVSLNDGSTSRLLGDVTIPTLAGTDAGSTPNVNLLSSLNGLQADGSLILEGAHLLKIAPESAVTATFAVDIVSQGGDL